VALAFLLALLLSKTCPFYILDEVEAALDDINIGLFVSLVRDYRSKTQFLIITHQKRTMEAADLLYGVTMGSTARRRSSAPAWPRKRSITRRERAEVDWHEAFKGLSSELPAVAVEHEDEERRGLFAGCARTSARPAGRCAKHFRTILFDGITDELWEQIEEALIFADVGVEATVRIVEQLEREAAEENLTTRDELLGRLSEIVAPCCRPTTPTSA